MISAASPICSAFGGTMKCRFPRQARFRARMLCGPFLLCAAVAFALVGCGAAARQSDRRRGSTDGPAYEGARLHPARRLRRGSRHRLVRRQHRRVARRRQRLRVGDQRRAPQVPGDLRRRRLQPRPAGDGTPINITRSNIEATPTRSASCQNTSGNNYVEIASASAQSDARLRFEPYLHPTSSATTTTPAYVTRRAALPPALLTGDVIHSIYQWVVGNIAYDYDKTAELATVTTTSIPTGPTRSAPASASTTRRLPPRCCAAWDPCQVVTGAAPDTVPRAVICGLHRRRAG